MGRNDWYRRTSWTEADQAEFFARLNRSRSPSNRAQYLRIQAWYLQQVGTPDMLRAAMDLLDRVLKEHPETFDLALVCLQKAECFLALGELEAALEWFRKAMQREREKPNVRTAAALKFAWTVVERGLTDLYDEALAALEGYVELNRRLVFAYERYLIQAVRAVIAEERGYPEMARELARRALEAAAQTHSGFRYHPKVGLVHDTDTAIHARLVRMAEGGGRSEPPPERSGPDRGRRGV